MAYFSAASVEARSDKSEGIFPIAGEIPSRFLFLLFLLFALHTFLYDKMDRAHKHCGAGDTESDPDRDDGIAGEWGSHFKPRTWCPASDRA